MQFRLIRNKSTAEIDGAEWQKSAEIVGENEGGGFDYNELRRAGARRSSNSEILVEFLASGC